MKEKLSIVIPVYNEEKRIGETIVRLLKFLDNLNLTAEIIVVDDGSTDKTFWMLERFKKHIKIIPISPNHGKGYAIRIGMLAASGDLIIFMDADLATPLDELPKIINKAKSDKSDIVIGSRNAKSMKVKRTPFRLIAGEIFKFVSHTLLPLKQEDTQCGFKLFTRKSAQAIFSNTRINRWAFDMEVLYLASKIGLRVSEMAVSWQEKAGSKVRMIRDSFLMINDLVKIRLFDLLNAYDLDYQSSERSFDVLGETNAKAEEI